MPGRRPQPFFLGQQPRPTLSVGTGVPAVAGMEFPAVSEDLSLADDAGGLPLVIRVSEPLRAAAETNPLIDVGKASSVDLRRPTGLSGSDALRGSEEDGSQFDIVTTRTNRASGCGGIRRSAFR